MRLLTTLLLVFLCGCAAAGTLDGVRVGTTAKETRLVLDLSELPRYRIFSMNNPSRVVVDLERTTLAARLARPDQDRLLVTNIRAGLRGERDLRVVVDLRQNARVATKVLPADAQHGHRLVVILTPESGAAVGDKADLSAHEPDALGAFAVRQAAFHPQVDATALPPLDASAVTARGARDLVIVIDPGHGGKDPGATGPGGVHEKDITLAIARQLKRLIDKEPGMRAVLTRNGDQYIGLRERMARARQNQADLFVSLHADSVRDRSVNGSSVYILSERGASNEAARWLAERENAVDLVGGVSLDDKDRMLKSVLLDLSQAAAIQASSDVAESVIDALHDVGEVRRRKVQSAGFVVLKSPDVPSILIETAYISNPYEERRLADARHQKRLASAILDGLRNYFVQYPVPGTLLADSATAIEQRGRQSAVATRD